MKCKPARKWQAGLLITVAGLAACSHESAQVYQGYAEGEFVRIAAPYAGSLSVLAVQRGAQIDAGAPLFALEQDNEKAARDEASQGLKRTDAQLENLKKGKRPAELDAIVAQREQARAALKLSEADFSRDEKLAKAGFISSQKLDAGRSVLKRDRERLKELEAQLATAKLAARVDEIRAAEAAVAAARATLARADWSLGQKSVKAPVAGLVQDTLYVQGEWVPAGSPVVSLLPPQNIKVRFFVPETRVGSLKTGQAVTLSCDGCAAPISAAISYISPQAEYTPPVIYSKENRGKLVFLVEARPAPTDAAKLRPGQPMDVRL
ncbi:secretion protein HlyD family protein [Sulfuricella denitrificans skB26]|uniref:Secretion protein HlyD family protein n=1 Tax=Sulfuricella denitrificans (strain DSM 22764 / NBRC 105220 / skB26) TaxID=1163617 RepID=S6AZU6_SULDS|nr:HlyD family efflux transporter periplasmic adaptor subunit [Sulfuricella denitrificans]BAN34027.1 secretion protein HlyD family protein [Sulfuricella denitrificans skB26]